MALLCRFHGSTRNMCPLVAAMVCSRTAKSQPTGVALRRRQGMETWDRPTEKDLQGSTLTKCHDSRLRRTSEMTCKCKRQHIALANGRACSKAIRFWLTSGMVRKVCLALGGIIQCHIVGQARHTATRSDSCKNK